ncbi:hypothetical protein JTE90_016308 [Oedothorax gibbosus]|uniref:UBZ4-type domain-containing protein n=1 Tax=Oedothorax gibbosus TaxID=931172 RepID=A0AAV6U7Q5_9ARAC|nr:hypothetical protein JTE90_016308 [Oedothorax gibbosus]
MMNEAELFGEADFEQAPCEFCDELFPFDLLIQHQSGCRPDIAHFTYGQNSGDDSEGENAPIAPAVKEVANVVKTPKIVQEVPQKAASFNNLGTDAKKAEIGKALKVETKPVQKSPPSKECGKSIVVEDPSLQETETKLMSYGSSSNKNQQIERERPSFKVPSLLNNADQRDLDEESRLLSDSDESESLEVFWKRAEIKNSQRLRALPSG